MNSQTRRELEFLQEQAILLEKNSVSLTQIQPKSSNNNGNKQQAVNNNIPNVNITPSIQQQPQSTSPASNLSKYSQLLMVIEEMSRDIRPTYSGENESLRSLKKNTNFASKPIYSGSRSSAERLKRTIVTARILVRECLLETERQQSGR